MLDVEADGDEIREVQTGEGGDPRAVESSGETDVDSSVRVSESQRLEIPIENRANLAGIRVDAGASSVGFPSRADGSNLVAPRLLARQEIDRGPPRECLNRLE